MGSISTYAAWKAAVDAPYQRIHTSHVSLTAVSMRPMAMWKQNSFAAASPSTAAVPDRTTAGALRDPQLSNPGTANQQVITQIIQPLGSPGMWWLCDRLSHQGGLSGIATGAQTTNLPTSALTRYTGGVGVMLRLEIYTVIGATATTVTASYTNQAGTAGQVTEAVDWGASGFREVGRCVILPLAAGDTGVKAVASVTAAATTGTAGNFGVTLFKPLVSFSTPGDAAISSVLDMALTAYGQVPKIQDSACLELLFFPSAAATGNNALSFLISETP